MLTNSLDEIELVLIKTENKNKCSVNDPIAMMQVPIFAILALALLKSTLAFDKRINFQSFKDCEQEFVNEGNGSKSWGSFYNIVPIDSLRNNEPNHDEILRTRMYYQGPRDLSVMLSDVNRDYQPGDAYFHTSKAHDYLKYQIFVNI